MSEKTNIATLDYLNEYDPAIGNAMTDELKRQRRNLELIASENIVSPAVMAAMGSLLTNKYAEGYPGKRYYGGCQCVDVVEEIARQRACELFGAEHANVQPHSGAQANTAVYFAMLNPGDTVMGMNLNEGGHLTHGSPVNISGKYFNFVPYGVDPETHRIDYDKVLEIAKECKPKMIVAGASAYPRIIDFAKLREIADAVGAYLMVDMAHIAGLVAADRLIILTDIDGLYDSNPRTNPNAKKLDIIEKINAEIFEMAAGTGSNRGTGGMITKLQAADYATKRGVEVSVINGSNPENLYEVIDGNKIGTKFLPVK